MRETLAKAIVELQQAGCETPKLDAEVLLAYTFGCERYELYTTINRCQALAGSHELFQNYIERRKKREPVAYIIGFKEFWSIRMKVTPDVLIPRPETEALVERVLQILKNKHATILDLGTGSGCIAAALATELPMAQFVVTDISKKVLEVAKKNLKFALNRVAFIQSDLFESVTGKFDLIVSNPPYIPSQELEELEPEVNLFEPRSALDGGRDGLDFIRRIRHDAPNFLKPEGLLILENGPQIEVWNASSLKGELNSKAPLRQAGRRMPSFL